MILLQQLSSFILNQRSLKLNRENITSFADNGQMIPSGEDFGNNSREIARFYYDAVIQIERFSGDAETIIALVMGWIMDNDPRRSEINLDDPQINVDYNDDYTCDLEFAIAFAESIQIIADPQGNIVFDGQIWSLKEPDIDTAETLDSMHGGIDAS